MREAPRPSLRGAARRATTPSTHTPLRTRARARFARAAFVRADRRRARAAREPHERDQSIEYYSEPLDGLTGARCSPPPRQAPARHAQRQQLRACPWCCSSSARPCCCCAAPRCHDRPPSAPGRPRSDLAPVVVRNGHPRPPCAGGRGRRRLRAARALLEVASPRTGHKRSQRWHANTDSSSTPEGGLGSGVAVGRGK